jgi:hypothetical protein
VPTERRVANREARPNRIFGVTWNELFWLVTPPVLIAFQTPPFLFGLALVILDWILTFWISRMFPDGAITDWLDGQWQLLRYGGRRYEPGVADPHLRNGGAFLRERA